MQLSRTTKKLPTMAHFILKHGIDGQGPINNFLVSESKEALINRVKEIIPEKFIQRTRTFFDSGDCVHIHLTKEFHHSGFNYDMFFIDKIESI